MHILEIVKEGWAAKIISEVERIAGPVRIRKRPWWVLPIIPIRFTITLWGTINWSPLRLQYSRESYCLPTLCHELEHRVAFAEHPVLWPLGYLLPQLLAVTCFLGILWTPLWFLALFLLPWPAYFRAKFEIRGYATSEFVKDKLGLYGGSVPTKAFTGVAYYFMWPFKKKVEQWLKNTKGKTKVCRIANELLQ